MTFSLLFGGINMAMTGLASVCVCAYKCVGLQLKGFGYLALQYALASTQNSFWIVFDWACSWLKSSGHAAQAWVPSLGFSVWIQATVIKNHASMSLGTFSTLTSVFQAAFCSVNTLDETVCVRRVETFRLKLLLLEGSSFIMRRVDEADSDAPCCLITTSAPLQAVNGSYVGMHRGESSNKDVNHRERSLN